MADFGFTVRILEHNDGDDDNDDDDEDKGIQHLFNQNIIQLTLSKKQLSSIKKVWKIMAIKSLKEFRKINTCFRIYFFERVRDSTES